MSDKQMKAGSYAVTTVYSMPWVKKETSTIKIKKKKAEKKVVNEVFERCSEITDDEYWISIFKSCARDKFPRGFQYKNGLMTHRRGSKITRVEIPNNTTEAFYTTTNFFKTSAGLMSQTDKKRLQKEQEDKMLDEAISSEISWKDIKIERVKELLISEYISDIVVKNKLSECEKNELTTTIKIGFMLKYFASKNIIMEKGRIVDIQGLIKTDSGYEIDPKLVTKMDGRKIRGLGIEKTMAKIKNSPILLWDKYLDNLEKKITGKKNFRNLEGSDETSNEPSPFDPTISLSPSGDSN